ncbi:MAG: Photosystem I reaction center subunit IX [Leptolyngbyaceae cyanobacterium SU_3_3]|nr:Photosystem I reaction center subunit IX [Leptolyngbyaceae cyanobacterium SU_3_3]NJR49896.1 Photosystem I reaction center subunit IX [Leptolyngbyaceae cyanobacterium CSU_1_3]
MSAFLKYLSNAPILAIVTTSFFLTLFILINWVSPDRLVLGQ